MCLDNKFIWRYGSNNTHTHTPEPYRPANERERERKEGRKEGRKEEPNFQGSQISDRTPLRERRWKERERERRKIICEKGGREEREIPPLY